MRTLTYRLGLAAESSPYDTERRRYALEFLLVTIGTPFSEAPANARADLVCGHADHDDQAVTIVQERTQAVWADAVGGRINAHELGRRIPFDIVHATGALLTDSIHDNLGTDSYDAHERLLHERSVAATENLGALPLVNIYVDLLRKVLEANGLLPEHLPLWPKGKRFCIALSHDVDNPDKQALGHILRFSPRKIGLSNLRLQLRIMNALRKRIVDRDPNNFWLFDDIMNEEARYGFSSSFYFASTGAHDRLGRRFDVDYSIDWPHFRALFPEILRRGHEVGLHAGYGASGNPGQLAQEKLHLEHASGTAVSGLRHHFWHLGHDAAATLRAHEEAGFAYDSSLAFNNHLGYRRNVALPYFPWDRAWGRPLRTLQLPPFCMDGNLFYGGNTMAKAITEIRPYLAAIEKFGGFGAIDWHVRTSYPKNAEYMEWGRTYVALLKLLSENSNAWVTRLDEVHSWVEKRVSSLKSGVI